LNQKDFGTQRYTELLQMMLQFIKEGNHYENPANPKILFICGQNIFLKLLTIPYLHGLIKSPL